MMKINKIYEKGVKPINEDNYYIGRNVFAVFDGAGSWVNFKTEDGKTGGKLASDIAKEIFSSSDDSLEKRALKINKEISNKMKSFNIDISVKENLWNVALSSIKVKDNKLEFFGIGDCFIIVLNKDGGYKFLMPYEDHDESTMRIMKEFATSPERGKKVKEDAVKVRIKANIDYGFINGENEAKNFFKKGVAGLDNVKSIILSTDGLMIPQESPSEGPDWNLFISLYKEGGLEEILKYVLSIENSDPDCIKYPRFKKHDDKAAISIDFE